MFFREEEELVTKYKKRTNDMENNGFHIDAGGIIVLATF